MTSLRAALVSVISTFASGCVVESRTTDQPDAGFFDASTRVDAGVDAGTCADDAAVCGRDFVCSDRRCAERTECSTSSECVISKSCWVPENESKGVCRQSPTSCGTACPSGTHCGPGGCGPSFTDDGELLVVCSADSECGPGGVCSQGACRECSTDLPCRAGLVCSVGACVEPETCSSDTQCLGTNSCASGKCTRRTASCKADPANDAPGTGSKSFLPEAYSVHSICGVDVDRFEFTLEPDVGARIVITSTASELTVRATASVRGQGHVSRLALPGRTVIEVSALDSEQEVELVVSSLDSSGEYAIDLRFGDFYCASDALDLYGDEETSTAPVVSAGFSERLSACVNDVDIVRVALEAGDSISANVTPTSDDGAELSVSFLDPFGQTLAEESREYGDTTPVVGDPSSVGLASIRVDSIRAPTLGQAYELSVDKLSSARVASCLAPERLTGSRTIDLAEAADIGGIGCARGRGAVFQVRERPGAVVRARVHTVTGSPVGLAALSACANGVTVECSLNPSAAIEWVATATPTYVAVASDSDEGTIELSLDVDLDDNFTCTGNRSEPITTSGVIDVDTVGATNTVTADADTACLLAEYGAGPDRFFALSLRESHRAVLELEGPEGGLLWAAESCAQFTATCTAAAAITETPAVLVLAPGDAANYVIAVDGRSSDDQGTFRLKTILDPECVTDADCRGQRCDGYVCQEPPSNDACDGVPITLVPDINGVRSATVAGSTGAASDDFHSSCGGGGLSDVVYRLELAQRAASLRVRITQEAFDAILAVRRAPCEVAVSELGCEDDETDSDLRPNLTLLDVPAGTYFVIVDSFIGEGAFTLVVEAR
ncbi:MAG: hypothetical protein HY791_03280 [Deltaproteobacteria bacterium]|nr:hypothetical protein [Deltaproteobacteria bacterium]